MDDKQIISNDSKYDKELARLCEGLSNKAKVDILAFIKELKKKEPNQKGR